MHLTSIRYQATPSGPWKSAIAVGTPEQVAEKLENLTESYSRHGYRLATWENGEEKYPLVYAVRFPDGRVFDIEAGSYIEEEKAHA